MPKVLSPAFSQYECYFFARVMFKLVDTVNVKGDLGGSTKQQQLDYETCYQTNRTVTWSENLISLAWNFTNLRYMYNNYYQDLLLLVIMEGYLECGRHNKKSKHFCSNATLCVSFIWYMWMVKTCMIKLQVIEGPNACDQMALNTFHSFFISETPNKVCQYIHAVHA